MNIFWKGFATGLVLQLAVGPVFFYVMSLSAQRTWMDGLVAAAAVTTVDLIYVTLAIAGIGTLLEKNKKTKKALGAFGALALVAFGALMLRDAFGGAAPAIQARSTSLVSSFASVFALTLFNPMTILFFTGLFSAKAAEYDFSGKELRTFGFGTVAATMTFMGALAVLFSVVGGSVPLVVIRALNATVGCLLIGYGVMRLSLAVARRT